MGLREELSKLWFPAHEGIGSVWKGPQQDQPTSLELLRLDSGTERAKSPGRANLDLTPPMRQHGGRMPVCPIRVACDFGHLAPPLALSYRKLDSSSGNSKAKRSSSALVRAWELFLESTWPMMELCSALDDGCPHGDLSKGSHVEENHKHVDKRRLS